MTNKSGRWLALLAAVLGWLFDGLEMGLFPLVARDALGELLNQNKDEHQVHLWYSYILAAFLIGAASGGVLFGWLGDKYGRARAMMLSVLCYSLCSGLSAFVINPWQLAALRFLGALGMGGEWALGVALVMELWPDKSRPWLAALIGAAGNLGFAICGLIALGLNSIGDAFNNLPLYLTHNNYWRLLMLIGAAPALLTFFIRIYVPESHTWQKYNSTHARWTTRDLLAISIGTIAVGSALWLSTRTYLSTVCRIFGIVTGLGLGVATYLWPVYKFMQQDRYDITTRRSMILRMLLAAALCSVPLLGTWCAVMWMYQWVNQLPGGSEPHVRPMIQLVSSFGAAIGAATAALLSWRTPRRVMYITLCTLSGLSITLFYTLLKDYSSVFLFAAGVMSFFTASFYGWLPLYLPELFPTSQRATAQGFSFNFGRVIAAFGTLHMPTVLYYFQNNFTFTYTFVPLLYVFGITLVCFAPETHAKPLPR